MKAKNSKERILGFLIRYDLSLDDLAELTGCSQNGIRGRISELKKDGYVIIKKKRTITEYSLEAPVVESERSTPGPIASKKVVKQVVKEAKQRQEKKTKDHEWTFEEENDIRKNFFPMVKQTSKHKAEKHFAEKFGISQYLMHKKLVYMGIFLR